MKNLKQISLGILILFLSIGSFAQQTISFPKEINSMKLTAPGVVIVATDDALYGLDKNGTQLWKKEKLKKVDAHKIEILEGSELILVHGGFRTGVVVINVLTGEYIGANDGPIYGARVIHGTNQVWIIKKYNKIDVWDIKSNVKQYAFDKVSLPYGLESSNQTDSQAKHFKGAQPITYTSESSAILHIGVGQLGEFNLNNGTPIWQFDWKPYKVKKPKDGKGDIASTPGRGFAVMKIDKETNTIYFPFRNILIAVDSKTGKPKWDVKANKFQKVNDIHVTKDGIVVKTPNGIELIDPKTGNKVWDKPIKIKGSEGGVLVQNEGAFYVVAKNTIEKVDITNRKSKTLTDKIKFKGGESFSSLELVNNIVVLASEQNMVGVDKNSGAIKYQIYLKPPGPSVLDVAGNVVLATVAVAATANSMNVNAQSGSKTYYQYTPAMMNSGGSKTQNNDQNQYINTKFNETGSKGFGVAKVEKESGKIVNKIVLGTRDPEYVVNPQSKMIFYKSDKTTLTLKSVE
ncbi:MAG: PQQ-binding-like beta-propeller repeat protein [Salibacteraceae bacterium]